MNPLTDSNEAFHHELRREAVPPSVDGSGSREHPHRARQERHRPTSVLPDEPVNQLLCLDVQDGYPAFHYRPAFGRRAS